MKEEFIIEKPIDVYAPSEDTRTAKQILAEAAMLRQLAYRRMKKDKEQRGEEVYEAISTEISLDGMLRILKTKAPVKEVLEQVRLKFEKSKEWLESAKNRELFTEVRQDAVKLLEKQLDDIDTLNEVITNGTTSFKEIRQQATFNNQLKHLYKAIMLSDRLNRLEERVSTLEKKEVMRDAIDYLVFHELMEQREIVESLSAPTKQFEGTPKEIELLKVEVAYLDTEEERLKYLLDRDIPKVKISEILNMNYRTLMRRLEKLKGEK